MSYESNIWKIYLANFLNGLHFFSAVLVPFFTDWGGISFTAVMILQSWFMLCIFLLEVPTGFVADKWGRKQSLFLGSLASASGFLIYVSKPEFSAFIIGEFFIALGVTLVSGASEAFIYDTLEVLGRAEESKTIFGRMGSFKMTGMLVSGPTGSLIAGAYGLTVPMWITAFVTFLAALVILSVREPPREHPDDSVKQAEFMKASLRQFRNTEELRILSFDFISINIVGYFMLWLYQPLLESLGVQVKYFGFVFAFLMVVEILFMNNYVTLEKIFGSKNRVMFLTAVIPGIGFLMAGLTEFLPIVILGIALAGAIGLGRDPMIKSYMNKFIESENRATVMSAISMYRKLFLLVLSPLMGLSADINLKMTVIMIGVIGVIMASLSRAEERHLID